MSKIHFIAIGGSVMHQLAIAMHDMGFLVSGSDDEIFEPARSELAKRGLLPPSLGWFSENITADLSHVILGMHARPENPELKRAQELSLQVLSFPEFIYTQTKNKQRIVVAGSHGKTTTTAMIMHVLKSVALDFDYLVGARLNGFETSVNISQAPLFVCEGDEYPASVINKKPKFLFYQPDIAILTGIAWDHINVFPSFGTYTEQFAAFLHSMKPGAVLIFNQTDPVLAGLIRQHGAHLRLIPYRGLDYSIQNGVTEVHLNGKTKELKIFGKHNMMNLNAAWLACQLEGISEQQFLEAIPTFAGASKRLEQVYQDKDAGCFRDFAHAPSKVQASVQAVKTQYPDRKLIGVLELHTYSSLNTSFLPEYRHTMDLCDVACVYYSKHALEIKHMPDLNPSEIRANFGRDDLKVFSSQETFQAFLKTQNFAHSNLLLMSSGNFDNLSQEFILDCMKCNR